MSNGPNSSESPAEEGKVQSQLEIMPSGCQLLELKPSSLRLTVENVKKLEEEYPVAGSVLTRLSVEAFVKQSNQFLNRSETSTDGSKKQNLSEEKDSETASMVPHKEDSSEDCPKKVEAVSEKDHQTRSSVLETASLKKHEVADLETQTEWSYSDMSSTDSSEQSTRIRAIFPIRPGTLDDLDCRKHPGSKDCSRLHASQPLHDHSITDLCHLGCCEFCSSHLMPIPTAEELNEKPEAVENFLCCRTYKEVFECVVQELLESNAPESEIDISPHPRLSQALMESKTKKLIKDELEERGFESYREILKQFMRFGQCTTIKFRLSDHPPKPQTAAKKRPPQPKELLKIDVEFKAEQLKICHPEKFVKRYYPDGKIFFLLFPDGTGQIYYPSGNIAVLITYLKDVQYTYILLSDSPSHAVQAFFSNQGFAACYYQNGKLRVNLDLCLGSYFDPKGVRLKHWNWWDTDCHVHAPPFQPICIQLNVCIQVKIEAQDQIFLTFTKLHDCLQLNVGARLKLKDPNMLHFLKSSEAGRQLSHSKVLKIRSILSSLQKLLKKICSFPPERTEDQHSLIKDLCDLVHLRQKRTAQAKQTQ
ncbi:glutamate-rich protein 6B [Varanus komodoensis]|uniref:glutamate-rich protein 6B n=1 Tax=Varanus komodoensis TaxID=61221 RepID=UPI001CF79168|nr:glutamate-rich protein 6B [Varanus komodoensis]